jgi:hypothetical protein
MNAAIITKSAKALALTTGGLLATASLVAAAAPAPTTPTAPATLVETATYAITYTCTGGPGCAMGVGYGHTYKINVDSAGGLTGTGTQDNYAAVTESLGGSLAFSAITRTQSMNFVSTYTGYLAGYTVTVTGSVDPISGALSGTASSGYPGNTDGNFSVSGTRTSLTIVPPVVPTVGGGTGSGGKGDNEDVKKVNPPVKHDADETKAAPKPKPTPKPTPKTHKSDSDSERQGDTRDAGSHDRHGDN